ncbi:predicted protein [Sclerotinia sclerotiorum 1980 UF-70]|uniref:Uncharacterized protein n=2 Tax=Sclerotinia sclerotiorum (strain ATCC 18683 / 1980 / Ss-1) TaxID=665079 RepID=A7ECZ4_SCLS1|nr:predicted protein [Sclerotinia sclerotiorum 1980 UF-70]APA11083.1 hypothetical protein sscle_07g058530 [Sclerotinia sclerotiorum 1980 UF-70]EDO00710.1 predicted protein [Sclerotinia sclerotiorum 1980 UF-70]
MSKNFGKSAATDAPTFTFNLDPNPSTKKKDGTPFKPCPRTDCVGLRTKHKQLEWQLKEANITIKATEGVAKARLAQSESYDQRLQAAHIELAASESIVAKLEARYIEEKKNENYADSEAKYIEEKQKNRNYEDLEEKYFALKQKMAQTSAQDLELIRELRKQIVDLQQANQTIEEYIRNAEVQIAEREKKCDEQDEQAKKRDEDVRELRTKALTYARETKKLTEETKKAQDEAAKLQVEVIGTREAMQELQNIHVEEKTKLEEKIKVEEKRLEDFRSDAREIQKENAVIRATLEKSEVEAKELRVKLEAVTEELKTKPSTGRTAEEQVELKGYINIINGLIQQLRSLEDAQQTRFNTAPGAYSGSTAPGGKPPLKEGDSVSISSISSSEDEDESTHDEQEDKLSFIVQSINKIKRVRDDSGFGRKTIVQIKEVYVPGPEIIVEVPGPPVEVLIPVPGPIQFVDREVPVPGPTVYIDVPGPNVPVPGPVRYTPFRVFAHDPIVCWLLVEFNFLVLFCHWLKHILSVLSYIPATLLARPPYIPSPPEDKSSSDESGAEGAADVARAPRAASSLFSVLFNPRRGRLPDTWHTFRGLAFHGVVYGILWLLFTALHERNVWIAENESSRKWLQQLVAQSGSNGFLGMNQILPQTISRQLDIWRFDLMEFLGIPVTFQFPG